MSTSALPTTDPESYALAQLARANRWSEHNALRLARSMRWQGREAEMSPAWVAEAAALVDEFRSPVACEGCEIAPATTDVVTIGTDRYAIHACERCEERFASGMVPEHW